MKIIYVWTVLSFLSIIACKSASSNLKENTSTDTKISEDEMSKRFLYHRRLMYECFQKYIEYSDFLDTNGRVSAEGVEAFKDLFFDNARIWNDYAWEPSLIDADVYADNVYYYHRLKGLKVEYEEGVLNDFFGAYLEAFNPSVDVSDPTNHTYRYEFRAKKRMYYILNKNKEVLYYDEPIEFELIFVFYVSSSEKWAKIMDILPAT